MQNPPTTFWGKLHVADNGATLWHPLDAHCADVAACCEALLKETLLGERFAVLCGRKELDERTLSRLVALAALHDLGKFSIGFQNKAFDDRMPKGGHVQPIMQALSHDGGALYDNLRHVLAPFGVFGDAAQNYLVASISHHGAPEKLHPENDFRPDIFSPAHGLDPIAGMQRLVEQIQKWCPRAFEEGAPLPMSAPAQHFFAGIVMLADWLGSDRSVFEFANGFDDPMPKARERAARVVKDRFLAPSFLRPRTDDSFRVFGAGFEARPAQSVLTSLPLPRHPRGSLSLLEAETGSGKTEAALVRFAQLFKAGFVDGLYFALPTRTSATQIHERVRHAVETTFEGDAKPPVLLAVPGYLRVDDQDGTRLPDFEFLWPDKGRDRHRTWAAENSKRYLAGSIVVGTIDQVLLSTLVVSHAHLRATALSRLFLVVDEVHASDAYMTSLLDQVLSFHLESGGHALLMSATLGTTARARYFARATSKTPLAPIARTEPPAIELAERLAYPLVTHADVGEQTVDFVVESGARSKSVRVELLAVIDDAAQVAKLALEYARQGAQTLVLRNTVADAIATQEALEALGSPSDDALFFSVEGLRTLHHSRFVGDDRRKLDAAIEERLGKRASRAIGSVVVATQTVQQSLDLDADVLLTDLCPMDVLLQRIGRLHRHDRDERPVGFAEPRCVVLDPGSLASAVSENGRVRARHGFGSVYEDLRVLEATRDLCVAHPVFVIPRDNRMLVERSTHPTALEEAVLRCGPGFEAHARSVEGATLGERSLARIHSVQRSQDFGDYGFPAKTEAARITTRLGEEDRLFPLEIAATSPFGSNVRELKLAAWMARGIPSDASARALPRKIANETEIEIVDANGSRALLLRYDRLGLRIVKEESEKDADD